VRIIPLIGGILKTSQVYTTYTSIQSITFHTHYSYHHLLLLGINLWKGMLKKQPLSACFLYSVHRSNT
jgi:hypothetical protein